MTNAKKHEIRCATHGVRAPAVICNHLLAETDEILGFVENSSEPDDLQAWCDDCERLFMREKDMTPAFEAFNDMTVVCVECYLRIRDRSSKR